MQSYGKTVDNRSRKKISVISLCVISALAKSAMAAETNEEEKLQENKVTVTGSQIKGVDLADAQPLKVISADDIKKSNASTLSELLKDLGVFRGGDGSFNTSTSGALSTSTPAGMAAATLRGLGASSTLTLVNGRRIAASSFAAGNVNFVDVNGIPLAAIERIEVLATGASATYGADAVAGVVNYILKDDYDGAEVTLSYADSPQNTDESKKGISVTFGRSSASSNFLATLDYFNRDDFKYSDREQTASTFFPIFGAGIYPSIYWRDSTSGFAEVDPACPDDQVFFDPEFGDASCAFDPNPYFDVFAPLKTLSSSFSLTKDVTETTQVFADFLYSTRESTASSTPNQFRGIDDSTRSAFVSTNNPGFLATPSSFQSFVDSGASDFRVRGRFLAPRKIGIETESFHMSGGLKGFVNLWDWETALTYSKNESTQKALAGIYNRFSFNAALFGELCVDGSTNCTPGVDGIWFNPFSGQVGNAQALSIMEEDVTRTGKSEVLGLDLKVSGGITEIAGNTVSVAYGVEFRNEKISDNPSELAVASDTNNYIPDVLGFGSSRVSAERDQYALFAEAFVPLSDRFSLQLAGRYDHYDNFGGDFNPKVGFKWTVNDSLVLRGTWATSFRAPSLSQSGIELRTTSFTANCIADTQVFCANQADVGGFSLEIGNPNLMPETSESISYGLVWSATDDITITADAWMFEHDNIIDVDAEGLIARALQNPQEFAYCGLVPQGEIGIVIDNEWCGFYGVADGENLTPDILQDSISDAAFFDSSDPLGVNSTFQLENVGSQTVSGFDLTYTQYLDTDSIGRFTLLFDSTYLSEFDRNRTALSRTEDLAGTFRYPRIVASLKVKWSYEDLFASLAANYTHHYYDEVSLLGELNADPSDPTNYDALDYIRDTQGIEAVPELNRTVPSWTVMDAKIGKDFGDDITVTFGINNLFDRDAPFVYGRYLNADLLNHNVMGRYYRVTYAHRF